LTRSESSWIGWRFVAFPLAIIFIFTALPTGFGIGLSFFQTVGGGEYSFVGWSNYTFAGDDPVLWRALRNTLLFTLVNVPLTVFLAFPIAVALRAPWFWGKTATRVMYFLPSVISIVAIGLVWKWVLAPGQQGLLNYFLNSVVQLPYALGLWTEPVQVTWPAWLGNGPASLVSVIVVSTWRGLGFAIVLYLAAVGSVPQSYYDAAEVDGANAWQVMWRITWPVVRPMTFFLLITGAINALQVFDVVYVMFSRAGSDWADVLNLYLYREFQRARIGYAAMIGVVVLVITALVTIAQFWWMRKGEAVSA
jgi:multiple sugar transport system permease protein